MNQGSDVHFRNIGIAELAAKKILGTIDSPGNPIELEAARAIQAGTRWRGRAGYEYPANYPREYDVEMQVIMRAGNQFEGVVRADNGRIAYEVKGAIRGRTTESRVSRPIRGLIDFADDPITGIISGNRVDFELRHRTKDGQPAFCKGYLKCIEPEKEPGNSEGPEKATEAVNSDGTRKGPRNR
jgi:hypothetical protein